jgi:hypothetical protein
MNSFHIVFTYAGRSVGRSVGRSFVRLLSILNIDVL